MIALVVFTDGRWDVLARTLESAAENLRGPISRLELRVDGDAPTPGQPPTDIGLLFPRVPVISYLWNGGRLGFGGTIRRAWDELAFDDSIRYVFHLEDDFTFTRPVDLAEMAAVLAVNPQLAQLALRRQPWNDQERAAGGIVECWPDEYVQNGCGTSDPLTSYYWLEHRLFFTTNPSLYRRELCTLGWPHVPERTEEVFSRYLFDVVGLPWGIAPADVRAGYWGARDSGEAVQHIGDHRIGTGY